MKCSPGTALSSADPATSGSSVPRNFRLRASRMVHRDHETLGSPANLVLPSPVAAAVLTGAQLGTRTPQCGRVVAKAASPIRRPAWRRETNDVTAQEGVGDSPQASEKSRVTPKVVRVCRAISAGSVGTANWRSRCSADSRARRDMKKPGLPRLPDSQRGWHGPANA